MRTPSLKRSVFLFSLLYIGSITFCFAGPAINVGSLNEYIQAQKSTLAKRVYNTGDVTAFVRVNVSEIVYDDRGDSNEENLDSDAIINGKGTGIISSPPRLIIPANGMQTNRLVFTGARDKERYYRVRYIPVVPDNIEEFGLNDKQRKEYERAINAGVTVLTGFGTIVTVEPEKTKFDTRISGGGNELLITNNGNASVIVSDIKYCDVDLKNCSSPINVQLRPGRKLERKAPAHAIWLYALTEGSQKKNLSTSNPL